MTSPLIIEPLITREQAHNSSSTVRQVTWVHRQRKFALSHIKCCLVWFTAWGWIKIKLTLSQFRSIPQIMAMMSIFRDDEKGLFCFEDGGYCLIAKILTQNKCQLSSLSCLRDLIYLSHEDVCMTLAVLRISALYNFQKNSPIWQLKF